MKYALPLIALLLATPAHARNITITLNEDEQKAFLSLMDSALKGGGINILQTVNQLLARYHAAMMPLPPGLENKKK